MAFRTELNTADRNITQKLLLIVTPEIEKKNEKTFGCLVQPMSEVFYGHPKGFKKVFGASSERKSLTRTWPPFYGVVPRTVFVPTLSVCILQPAIQFVPCIVT